MAIGVYVEGSAGRGKADRSDLVHNNTQIRAGDGGFDIEVEGTTRLIGGAITSTDVAVEADLNRFNQNTEEGLARLELSDIQNHADYKGSGFSISGGISAPAEGNSNAEVLHGSGGSHQSAGIGRASGSDGSVTESGISGLAGNTDLRTGDDETGIDQIFDLNQVQNELDTSIMVTAEFGRISSQAWGEYAGAKEAQLWLEAQNEGDPDIRAELEAEASRWGEGGIYRISGHTLIGLAGGGTDGATGALAGSVVMPEVARLTAEMGLPEGGGDKGLSR